MSAGEGFILQRVTGPGTVWLYLSGEVIEKTLKPRVLAGLIGMQEFSVATDIQLVRGFRNILFGGEGLFLATLTGPGWIWLQSMPILNLAEEIARHLPSQEARDANAGAGSVAWSAAVRPGRRSAVSWADCFGSD